MPPADAWLPLIVAGLAAGLLAGLFGVGGGVVVVPAVLAVLVAAGVGPDLAMKLALGTSLASIVFTGSASAWQHRRLGSVRWDVVAALAPGLVIGAAAAGIIAHLAPGAWLRYGFAVFLVLVALRLLVRPDPAAAAEREPPPAVTLLAIGILFGLISGLAGVGGGTLIVPLLLWIGFALPLAAGTAAASGVAIALAGSLSFLIAGWGHPDLPPGALGYVYLPGLAAVVVGSVAAAPAGARAAHQLPVRVMRVAFASLLLLFAAGIALGTG